jgi:hypothetical protein
MATASATIDIPASADQVWQLIGGFNTLPDWLPFIPKSELSEGGRVRTLKTADGGVVIDVGGGLQMPVTPMSGEYANQTYFITDDDALERVRTATVPGRAERVAVFTDGIQRLAVDLTRNVPHAPFFRGFFEVLSQAAAADEDRLHAGLLDFLGGSEVEKRTDDDKTLVLAALGVPAEPCCHTA